MSILSRFTNRPSKAGVTLDDMKARYEKLCAARDQTNASLAALKQQLDDANARSEAARREANGIAEKINEIRGGQAWLDMKKEIGLLATALSGRR